MTSNTPIVPHLLDRCDEAVASAETLLDAARKAVTARVSENGAVSSARVDAEQRATHGFAWYATYVEALRQMARWARALDGEGKFGTLEQLILQAAFGEYLAQLAGGVAMSQGEIARPYNLGLTNEVIGAFWTPVVDELTQAGTRQDVRTGIADYLARHDGAIHYGAPGLDDTMVMIREQFFRFAQDQVRGGDGLALGAVDRGRVGQLDVLTDVAGRDGAQVGGVPAPQREAPVVTVGADGGDGPGVAVRHA